jgi:hypothetical protein
MRRLNRRRDADATLDTEPQQVVDRFSRLYLGCERGRPSQVPSNNSSDQNPLSSVDALQETKMREDNQTTTEPLVMLVVERQT